MADQISLPRSVVEQALEALEHAEKDSADFQRINTDQTGKAIEALRAALEQPQGESDEFYEWWAMRPSLTRLQAYLVWREEQGDKNG